MIPEFHYRVRWRAAGAHPGRHASHRTGGGYEFAGHQPFAAFPDPRNIDSHATLNDPFGQLMVKTFRQRSAIPVFVLADLSASMGYADKVLVLAEFTSAAAYSAYRSGDPFGLIVCGETIRWDVSLPLRWHKGGLPADTAANLARIRPDARSAAALEAAVPHLGRGKALVLLVSDFHLDDAFLESLFDALRPHDVVPVAVWSRAEYDALPDWGLIHLRDPETGQRRRLFMRPALKRRFRDVFQARRERLRELAVRHGAREPFLLEDRLDADALTRYFYET
ncbi:DUF58 domain-containing protein [Methylococcus capsulatus]|uniref:DUF58 domain-containing protein n=1 Tax=Methylococcus capsulatus TaxID=414 RepID=UPI001C5275BD|nr:DUF58 domain-containing protein [Methylococcus capsulatus]QXP87786.1 hypothetical protein KW112_01105 [Methylococcus capsulatus]UQN12801.1 hypothetical protein M3M30_02810 [Methylococcus capsulatus]